ncbi:MAG: radical protein [Actinomycetota bacterium]|nr:radical protein [Actinomycetota bacterium]
MRAVRYLILWPTAACDLDCGYCYRRQREPATMTWPTAAAALDLAAVSGAPFHVQLAGGEPTLVPDLVARVVTEVRRRRWPATLAIQTNGLGLDPAMVRLLAEHQVQVGASLDGPPPVHDRLRGRSADTFRGLGLLRDAGVPATITTVVTSVNAPHLGELVTILAGFSCVRGLGLDPLVRLGSAAGRADLAASPAQLADGVRALYRRLGGLRALRGTPLVWRELAAVRRAAALRPGPDAAITDYCHACRGESLAVAPDGTLYPCSQAVGDPGLVAGNIHDPAGIDWSVLDRAFAGRRLRGPCGRCPLRRRCPGDCPSRLAGADADSDGAAMCLIYRTLAELEGL